jgi:hydrogenase expression/formation protein HypC
MCIGIPGQICAIDGNLAKVEVCGIQREVDLTLVGSVMNRGSRASASGFWSTWASP